VLFPLRAPSREASASERASEMPHPRIARTKCQGLGDTLAIRSQRLYEGTGGGAKHAESEWISKRMQMRTIARVAFTGNVALLAGRSALVGVSQLIANVGYSDGRAI